ncbi:MAG: hypothetical protein ACREFX_12910 [Opitutaceae bacterium]
MNQRVTSPAPAATRRTWYFMPLLLLALVVEVAQGTAPPLNAEEGPGLFARAERFRPYLPFIGPPPLRFRESLPPPDLSSHPPPADLSSVGPKTPPAIVQQPEMDVPVKAPPPGPTQIVVRVAPEKPMLQARPGSPASFPANPGPPPLLPDDGSGKVKPEDFLPFFQFPGQGQPPPSTATYQQQ